MQIPFNQKQKLFFTDLQTYPNRGTNQFFIEDARRSNLSGTSLSASQTEPNRATVTMAEEEVNYASVVFKSNQHPPPQARKEEETVYDEVKEKSNTSEETADTNAKKEETVYDEVKGRSETIELTADTNAGFYQDKTANRCCNVQYQRLACCLGILCVILLSVIIAVVVLYHLSTVSHQSDESGLMASNRNLTNLNNKLILDNEKTMRDNNNLTVQLDNLTQNYVLESKITDLTTRNQQLETQNQQLETQRNNLTEQIRDLETNWNKLNVSRAQWSIDAYCPKDKGRRCKACQEGWELTEPSCYEVNNVSSDQKTWEEAREDCRGKGSDLAVYTKEEHGVISKYSVSSSGTDGYWFGLRAEGGRWKWVDGSDPNKTKWTPHNPPTDGQCVMSVQNAAWQSVSCTEKKRWICKMKALSV
ncbi:C-type lectin domain family 10 member A-like isoform X1 [Etheostoma cragini]|uniref:C-type lectin domain family 10 member A-like isoform X1 n=1 Tax=Etheostoma cragini TaxID=417921 RepID=UPI00155EA55B|nr:C-type lectin domain family 10 member A-like isoform X1 [Etheostoma cragini]